MRQLNFLFFFALCLGMALFSIENTQPAAINLIPGQQVEAPLSIELLVAVGTGALLAWIFSVLDQLQRQIESWKTQKTLKQQSKKIEELEQTIADLQTKPETSDEVAEVEESKEEPKAAEPEVAEAEENSEEESDDDTEEKTEEDEVASEG